METKTLNHGYLIALLSAVILAWTGIFIAYLTTNYAIPSLVLAFWRELFVAMVLFIGLRIFHLAPVRITSQQFRLLLIYGFILATFNSFWTLAVSLSGAAVATVLVYSSGGFTAVLGLLIFKEKLDWSRWAAIILSIIGCLLVSQAFDPQIWQSNTLGIITGVLSGLMYAIYTLMGREAVKAKINPWTTILYTFGIASLILLIINLLPFQAIPGSAASPSDLLWLGSNLKGWGVLLLLAAGPTVLGFGLYNMSLQYLQATVANLIVTLKPVFTPPYC